jgi:hypothetical protein
MRQLHAALLSTQGEPGDFSARLARVFIKRGIELFDMNGTLRCWTCGNRWDGTDVKPEWWLCPCLCNAVYR